MRMKSLFLSIAISIIVINTYAQEMDNTRIYETRSNIPVFACDLLGQKFYDNNSFSVPPFRSKFALVKYIGNDSVLVRFLSWSKQSPLYIKFNKAEKYDAISSAQVRSVKRDATDTEVEKYFLMTRSDLDSNCIKVFNDGYKSLVFTFGLVTMPMKIRLGKNFDFQGNLSLGTTAGAKMRLSKYNPNYINFLFGASISAISLDSFSTKGKVSGQPITNMAVFSPSLGLVFEFGKAQAGIFYGWDILNKSNQSMYGWIHNKKPWLSVGFGVSIFNVNSKSNNTQNRNNSSSPSD
jgi:hypothetical protein